jgi:hypothetical protein
MADGEQNDINEIKKAIRDLVTRVTKLEEERQKSSKGVTLKVPLGDSASARRRRWLLDEEVEQGEFLDEVEGYGPFGYPADDFRQPSRFTDRYLGGLNAFVGDTLEWLSESTDRASKILQPRGSWSSPFAPRGLRRRRLLRY